MQNKPELKSTGLFPPEKPKEGTSVHVFGKNLEDRVVKSGEPSEYSLSFTSGIPNKSLSEENDDTIESIRKRKFEAITGEEDESTIFQGDFKLFVWDLQTSNWLEKGRGQLKLNDSVEGDKKKSRLIMRVNGTLRIILNVAIQSNFRIIVSSKNNIRFTDSQTVWAASGSYASQLNNFIEDRLKIIREEKDKEKEKEKEKDKDQNEEQKEKEERIIDQKEDEKKDEKKNEKEDEKKNEQPKEEEEKEKQDEEKEEEEKEEKYKEEGGKEETEKKEEKEKDEEDEEERNDTKKNPVCIGSSETNINSPQKKTKTDTTPNKPSTSNPSDTQDATLASGNNGSMKKN